MAWHMWSIGAFVSVPKDRAPAKTPLLGSALPVADYLRNFLLCRGARNHNSSAICGFNQTATHAQLAPALRNAFHFYRRLARSIRAKEQHLEMACVIPAALCGNVLRTAAKFSHDCSHRMARSYVSKCMGAGLRLGSRQHSSECLFRIESRLHAAVR